MRKIEENTFYNIYKSYLKKDYPATFVSSLYISFIYIFLFAPIYGFAVDLLHGINKNFIKILYATYVVLILFFIFKKYSNKKTLNKILKIGETQKHFKSWIYFLMLPLSMILGVGVYILISINIVKRFNLEGFLYNLF